METINPEYNNYTDVPKAPVIVLNTCRGKVVIPTQQIIRIQAISNYSKLFFDNGKTLVVAKVLHWFQEQGSFFSFIRIHRSHLINTRYIKIYQSGKGLLRMQSGEIFIVAKRKKTLLAKQLSVPDEFFADDSVATSQLNTQKIMAA